MKNGNNNSPPPYLIEYWLKGLLNEGNIIKKKKIKTNKNKSKKSEDTNTNDDEDNIISFYERILLIGWLISLNLLYFRFP
jgi:hypothetical protein